MGRLGVRLTGITVCIMLAFMPATQLPVSYVTQLWHIMQPEVLCLHPAPYSLLCIAHVPACSALVTSAEDGGARAVNVLFPLVFAAPLCVSARYLT